MRKQQKTAYVPLKAPGNITFRNCPTKRPTERTESRRDRLRRTRFGSGRELSGGRQRVTITALGDVFDDRLQGLKNTLKDKYQIEVADDKCFTGFDAYKNVIDSGVDVVIIATPPFFRPEHFKYATEKGYTVSSKTDLRRSGRLPHRNGRGQAGQAKGLCVITGTQRHHQRPYVESYKKVQEGLIGEITGGNVYWNQPMLWYRNREKGWSDMEWMIRDWVNWKWLSGDHIVEQHVHNIDVFNWFSGYKPKRATA